MTVSPRRPPIKRDSFWKTKTLEEMSNAEWESLCDGCARCCLESRRTRYRQDLFHPRIALQASGCGSMCLQGLCEPPTRSRLRQAHSRKRPHPELAAAELRLQARGRGPRSLLVASADFGRSQYGARSRRFVRGRNAGDGERDRGRRPRRSYRANGRPALPKRAPPQEAAQS